MDEMEKTMATRLRQLQAPLLRWFRANARDLPWRRTTDAYSIWVSEIMLQQTRVAAVLGYYDRFMKAFPSVEALACAPEERLMKLWEGLGYYSRARNLQKTAQIVTSQYGGRFPASHEALLALPGIGDYTASAVCAAAFGIPEPAVDGNVLRVVTRIADCHEDIMLPKTKQMIRAAVGAAMPCAPEDVHIFNQATMELGATVCVPNGPPDCGRCPAAELCLARQRGSAEQLPVKAPKKARRAEERTVFLLLRDDGRVALRKRPKTGLLAGLWEFPNVTGRLDADEAAQALSALGVESVEWMEMLTAKHIFTHVEWHMTGYVLRVRGDGAKDLCWLDAAGLDEHAVPSAFARYLEESRRLLQGRGGEE
jgi:A/G-specific adenine glycosylase